MEPLIDPNEIDSGVAELDELLAYGEADDPSATITRFMSEGATFEDASARALQLHELASVLGYSEGEADDPYPALPDQYEPFFPKARTP